MAVWTMTFGEDSGTYSVQVSIGGMTSARTLNPAASPLETSGDEDNDLFKPVRCETGYIKVIASPNELDELFNGVATDHPVTIGVKNGPVTAAGAYTAVWYGFVQQDAYTQPYVGGTSVVEIPIFDRLSALNGKWLATNNHGTLSIGSLLSAMFTSVGFGSTTKVYFPSETIGGSVFTKMNVLLDNWLTVTDEYNASERTYDNVEYMEILEDICKLNCYACRQVGNDIYFTRQGDVTSYKYITLGNIGTNTSPTDAGTRSTTSLSVAGRNHTMSVERAVSKVSVSQTSKESVSECFDLGVLDKESSSNGTTDITKNSESSYYSFTTMYKELDGDTFHVVNNTDYYSPVWYNFANRSSGNRYAGVGLEKISFSDNQNGATYNKYLTMCPHESGDAIAALTLTGKDYPHKVRNSIGHMLYLKISGDVQEIRSWDEGPVDSYVAVYMAIRIGNYYFNPASGSYGTSVRKTRLLVDRSEENMGAIIGYGNRNTGDAAYIPLPDNVMGKLTIDFYTDQMSSDNQYICRMIKDFSVEYSCKDEDAEESHTSTLKNDTGTKDEYSMDCNLAVGQGMMGNGLGYIMQTIGYAVKDTDSNAPSCARNAALINAQKSTATRAYKIGHREIRPIAATNVVTVGGHTCAIVAQSINWREGRSTLKLIQLK